MHLSAAPALPLPDRATLEYIPDGAAGTRATLERMRGIVKVSKLIAEIRTMAVRIVQGVKPKDWAGEAAAVQRWVQQNIRYVKDIRGVETLTPPLYTLGLKAGDCDDQAMLTAALLETLGHKTRLVALGALPGIYSHVLAETRIGENWYAVETIHPWPLGKKPARLPFRLVIHV